MRARELRFMCITHSGALVRLILGRSGRCASDVLCIRAATHSAPTRPPPRTRLHHHCPLGLQPIISVALIESAPTPGGRRTGPITCAACMGDDAPSKRCPLIVLCHHYAPHHHQIHQQPPAHNEPRPIAHAGAPLKPWFFRSAYCGCDCLVQCNNALAGAGPACAVTGTRPQFRRRKLACQSTHGDHRHTDVGVSRCEMGGTARKLSGDSEYRQGNTVRRSAAHCAARARARVACWLGSFARGHWRGSTFTPQPCSDGACGPRPSNLALTLGPPPLAHNMVLRVNCSFVHHDAPAVGPDPPRRWLVCVCACVCVCVYVLHASFKCALCWQEGHAPSWAQGRRRLLPPRWAGELARHGRWTLALLSSCVVLHVQPRRPACAAA